MRHSAVGKGPSRDPVRWPTDCPTCGVSALDYQREGESGDIYYCGNCGAVIEVMDRRDETGWCRAMCELHIPKY